MANSQMGLDPQVVAYQADTIRTYTDMLSSIAGEIGQTGEASKYPDMFGLGQVLTDASKFLAESAKTDVTAAAEAATEMLGRLSAAIAEQEAVSSGTDGYVDGTMSVAQAATIYNQVMTSSDALEGMSPEQVAEWFNRLSPQQQDSFVTGQHQIAGNTNGIPFDRRIEANVLNAQERLATGVDGTEKEYLERVIAGDVTLISYSPNEDRIIEMVGEYYPEDVTVDGVFHPKTQDILNYVPGTTADMQGFYNGETQEIARELVDRADTPGATVAFVYKDSPFPTFDPDGVYSSSWAASVGGPYHEFNTALGLENATDPDNPGYGGASVHSIEHSFATAAAGYAETQGTVFETRTTLGGIGMAEGWTPTSGTEYYSIASDDDIIRLAREKGSDALDLGYPVAPTEKNGFTEIDAEFEPAIIDEWVDGVIPYPTFNNPYEYLVERGDQHSRVAGVDDNPVTIDALVEIVDGH